MQTAENDVAMAGGEDSDKGQDCHAPVFLQYRGELQNEGGLPLS